MLRSAPSPHQRVVAISRDLPVPLERVWTAVADPEGWPGWHPGVRRLLPGPGGWRRGSACKLHAPWPGNAWLEVLEPPHRLGWLFFPDGLGLREEFGLRLVSLASGTRVTLEHRASGLIAPAWLAVRRRQAAGALARLEGLLGKG